MLTAAAIRCTVGLWPLAAAGAAAGEAGATETAARSDRDRAATPPAAPELPGEPPRPN
jgi:hypothetical protein